MRFAKLPMAFSLVLLLLAAGLAGCKDECSSSNDCRQGYICFKNTCVQGSPDFTGDGDVTPDAADADADADVDPDIGPDGDADVDDGGGPDADADDGGADGPISCTGDPECNDSNPCTLDRCNLSYHWCENLPQDGTDCDDGDPCNGVATCNMAGECVNDSAPICDDHNPCTFDTCVTGGSDCTHDPAPLEGNACDNELFCDGTDTCQSGACLATNPSFMPCNDSNACTMDTCEEGATGPSCTNTLEEVTFTTFTCGQKKQGTSFGVSDLSSYGSCSGTLTSGPEDVLRFGFESGGPRNVTFTLTGYTSGGATVPTAEYNELYVVTDPCDTSTCTQVGDTVTVTGLAAMTAVYIVVESVPEGAAWAVQATCSP